LVQNEGKIDFNSNPSGTGIYIYNGERKIVTYDALMDTKWILALTVDEEQVYKPLYQLLWIYIIIVVAAVIVAIFMSGILNRNIIRRLKLLSNASILLSQGEFDTEVECDGKDEIGDVSKAFNRMKSEIKETISELNASRMNYEELIENTADAIYSVNASGYLITANTVFLEMFSIDRNAVGNELFDDLVQQSQLGSILVVLGKEIIEEKHLICRKIDNIENRYYTVTLSPILDKNCDVVKGVTAILHDTSEQEHSRSHLEWISHHDSLTQLPNRFKLMEDMDSIILKAKTSGKSFAVLFIDLDYFKSINDTLGYLAGDFVLKRVGKMLQDKYMSYRIGADEFVLIIDEYESPAHLVDQIDQLSEMMNHSFELDLNTVYNSATIGVVIYPYDFKDMNEMMIRGDATLNYGKKNGRAEVQFYDYSISENLEQKVRLEKGLRKALDNKEFILFYQPIMDNASQTVKGFEALIRWKKKDGTIISPGQFMPIAENMVLIHDIGLWVIEQALYDLKEFESRSKQDLTMAVNLSVNQIKPLDFCDKVIEIINKSGVDPHHIEFEITETVLIESLDLIKMQFEKLTCLGIKISLDDFGTGYSSLNYIQNFPFHILKIDKSFIDYIREETTARSLVEYIIDIAHGLDMEIVAEGVENELQKNYLFEKNCDYMQGYFYSKPIPAEEVYQFISKHSRDSEL